MTKPSLSYKHFVLVDATHVKVHCLCGWESEVVKQESTPRMVVEDGRIRAMTQFTRGFLHGAFVTHACEAGGDF